MPAVRVVLSSRSLRIVLVAAVCASLALQLGGPAGSTHPSNAVPALSLASYSVPARSPGQTTPVAVEGWVTDARDGSAVRVARATLPGGLVAMTDGSGHFTFDRAAVERAASPQRDGTWRVDVSVTSAGYADWSISGAVYFAGDVLRLYAHLATSGQSSVHEAASLGSRLGLQENPTAPSASSVGSNVQRGLSVQGLAPGAATAPPATIRVYRTRTNVVEVVPFLDYVKHVLPNEWIPTWNAEALKAGAMAVKTYAWYWISRGGKQPGLGADVKDNTDDQVYDPNVSYASTDAAVDATFRYELTLGGSLFQTNYCAGSYDPDPAGDCPWNGIYMTQWGTAWHGDHGRTWGWITEFYYAGSVITPNPPGGGYTGTPPPAPTQPSSPPPTAVITSYTVGQGSDRADLFRAAYDRNGSAAALGQPISTAKWWLPYVSENNVQVQRFSGTDGSGNAWIVYDVLKASLGVNRAFVLSGRIGAEYSTHVPPGPEWLGAPTSDPFVAASGLGGARSQGFARGFVTEGPGGVQFAPWPQQFGGWEADYFAGHADAVGQQAPAFDLPGQPSLVRDVPDPSFDWSGSPGAQRQFGVGAADWSVQFTKEVPVTAGSYDFGVTADGGFRLWIDGLLALNSWQDRQSRTTATYNADMANGPHKIRLQYYSLGTGGVLQFSFGPRGTQQQAPPASTPQNSPSGQAALRVHVQWLGRGAAPSDSWVLPLKLLLSTPGNPSQITGFAGTTDRNGVALFQGLPAGTYDVHVKGPHSLQTARGSIALQPGVTADADMKTQIEGDVDGDNCVTVDDLATVQGMIGANNSTPGFVPAADLNGDGAVTMADLSLLRSGFDRCGDVSADNDFRIMSVSAPLSLALALAPWMSPASLQHTLSLSAVQSSASARVGDILKVDIVANAGNQPVDGASFVLNFDPDRFSVVDSSGKMALGAEPGLALPAVMGNWVDAAGGAIGYSAGQVQGDPPAGRFVVASIYFKSRPGAPTGPSLFSFAPGPSPNVQLTNGGDNLLARTVDLTTDVTP